MKEVKESLMAKDNGMVDDCQGNAFISESTGGEFCASDRDRQATMCLNLNWKF
jgi:hypothetical protein